MSSSRLMTPTRVATTKIGWYENTDGAGTFESQQIISTRTRETESMTVGDLDSDGDLDVLSGATASRGTRTPMEQAALDRGK